MRCNDTTPFSSSVGERKIMNHFVVEILLPAFVAARVSPGNPSVNILVVIVPPHAIIRPAQG